MDRHPCAREYRPETAPDDIPRRSLGRTAALLLVYGERTDKRVSVVQGKSVEKRRGIAGSEEKDYGGQEQHGAYFSLPRAFKNCSHVGIVNGFCQ